MHVAVSLPCSAPAACVPSRMHGLDTLRGLAAVLVVFLHAGIPYMTNPLQHLVWPARDAHPSWEVDAVTWCTECFLMPLFFVLAGFFSEGLLISRGLREFLTGRTKRLLGAMFGAGLIVLPVCLAVWILGWVSDGLYVPQRYIVRGLPPELSDELFGVGHLWFLQNLYVYCVALCVAHWFGRRVYRPRFLLQGNQPHSTQVQDKAWTFLLKPALPAIPCALILFWDPRIVLGFYQGFVPVISKLMYYSIYFFVGTIIFRHRDMLRLRPRDGRRYLLIAGVAFTLLLPLIREHTSQALTGARLAQLAVLLALFSWLTTFGLLSMCLRTRHGNNVATRYLANASFWVYLVHVPFVGLAQISISQLPLPTVCKFMLSGLTGLALALMTYEVFVRDTWLGEFLNGCRRPHLRVSKLRMNGQMSAVPITVTPTISAQPEVVALITRNDTDAITNQEEFGIESRQNSSTDAERDQQWSKAG